MSNWSSVILVWWGLEEPLSIARAEAIEQRYSHDHPALIQKWKWWQSGPKQPSLQFSAAYHANHFDPPRLQALLMDYEWDFPERTGFLWRDEEMDQYQAVYLLNDPDKLNLVRP